ncbi:hypothetical protein LJC36_05760, partial [Desulfovibrio sp. OttesenSCG-928-C14]|nr:hypothetical protein [Desulfovibrio sp. OttesenSCG-928-C14]
MSNEVDAFCMTAEKRLTYDQSLKLVVEAKKHLTDLILMANITYAGDEGIAGWVNMAKKYEEAGLDILELNMCCPNMSYNIQTTCGTAETGTKATGASMGRDEMIVSEVVKAIKQAVS